MLHTYLFKLLASKAHEVESQVKSADRISSKGQGIKIMYARILYFSINESNFIYIYL